MEADRPMTATTPLTVAIRKADDTYPRFDRHRDRNQLRRTVIELNTRGFTAKQISHYVGLNEQQIRHIICGRVDTGHKPQPVNPPNLSDEHCAQLERTADAALKLACRLRDEDPQLTWDALTHMGRGDLQELAVVLLAAVDITKPAREIFAWVDQLGRNL
jgi:hypothetical protein